MPLSYHSSSSSSRHHNVPSEPEYSWDARTTFSAPSTRIPQPPRKERPNLNAVSQPGPPPSSSESSIPSSSSRSHSHHPDAERPQPLSAPTRVLATLDSSTIAKTATTPRKGFMSSQSSLASDDRSSNDQQQHRSSPRSSSSAISKIASAFSRSSKSVRASMSPTVSKSSTVDAEIKSPIPPPSGRRPSTAPQQPSLVRPRTAPNSPTSPSKSQFASQFHARMNIPLSPSRDTSHQSSPRDFQEEQEPGCQREIALKTLLSKPAVPSSSVASLHSMHSDTDNARMQSPPSSSYPHYRGARKISAPSIDVAYTPQPQTERLNSNSNSITHDAEIRPPTAPYMSERHTPSAESLTAGWQPQAPRSLFSVTSPRSPVSGAGEPKQRNVLKRRPSGGAKAVKPMESRDRLKERELKEASAKVLRSVSSMEKVRDAGDAGAAVGFGLSRRSVSAKAATPPSKTDTIEALEQFRSLGHSTSKLSSQAPHISHREKGERAPPPAALNLTPAKEVVQAYKEQRLSPGPRTRASVPASPQKPTPPSSPHVSIKDGERSPVPYYTVYGNNSGKVIRAGGPEDRWSGVDRIIQSSVTVSVGVGKPAATVVPEKKEDRESTRSLTRKVSSRWKKVTGGVAKDESPSRPETPSSHSHARSKSHRPSLQEPRSQGRSVSLSMDGCSESHGSNGSHHGPKHSRAETDPTTGTGGPSRHDGVREETNGKLWRLMKRISTGALRDRFQAEKSPPPVPSIPKEYLDNTHANGPSSAPPARSFDRPSTAQTASKPGSVLVTSPLATSPVSPSISSYSKMKRPSTAPKTIGGVQPRPSMNTTSSSPNSSDVASSKFFNRTHSTRSSVSSYGEELPPPVPGSSMSASGHGEPARHIMPPHELLRIATKDEEERRALDGTASARARDRSPRRTISSPSEVLGSAPFKQRGNARDLSPMPICIPRRKEFKDSTPTASPTSPLIPRFEYTNAVNSSQSLKDDTVVSPVGSTGSGSGSAGGLNPPPRPARSMLRPSGTFGRAFGRNNSGSPEDDKRDAVKLERSVSRNDSQRGSGSTVRSRAKSEGASIRDRDERETSKRKTPLTFRPLEESSRKPRLTEQEKADIWDDLLQRSAQAGGTLHIGGGGLMSDDMRMSRALSSRLSNYSEQA